MTSTNCPRCKNQTESLLGIDSGFRNKLQLSGYHQVIPDKVCSNCYQELGMMVSSPTNLLNTKDKLKTTAKMNLWKSRVGLIRKARSHMQRKSYSEAVVAYEKYLKIIEMVFGVNQENLTPELLKEHAATKELTVIASVYWDLIRIYDTHEKYKARMIQNTQKLAQFARFTPMFVDLMKQAEVYKRKAKNPDIINKLLKQMANKKSRCFIATSAFESPLAAEVIFLTHWRDQVLINSIFGKLFIELYYLVSPGIAYFLDIFSLLKPLVRGVLRILIFCISKISLKNLQSEAVSSNLLE